MSAIPRLEMDNQLVRRAILILAFAATLSACGLPIYIPTPSNYAGSNPRGLEIGVAHKGDVVKKMGQPLAQSGDGRFFLYQYSRQRTGEWGLIGASSGSRVTHEWRRFLMLIEFDRNNVIKKKSRHECEEWFDPLCVPPDEMAMWEMIKELLGEKRAVQYRQAAAVTASLAESLHQAAARGDLREGKKLIAQGANVDAEDKNGRTPLHVAADAGQAAMAELLLAKGADVNAKELRMFSADTPLIMAVNKGDTAVVELLIAKGADINAKTASGATPLHEAISSGASALAALLIAKGANVNATDIDRRTPLHEAARQGQSALVEQLLAKGAKVNVKTKPSKETALAWAALGGNTRIVELLLANGADVNAKDKFGDTPLHAAIKQGRTTVVELLLARGADVNVRGNRAMRLAITLGHEDIVELLLRHGADANAMLRLGGVLERHDTPMGLAVTSGHEDIVELLKQHGAKE